MKKMNLMAMLLLVLTSFAFVSCDKDDEDENKGDDSKNIIGVWNIVKQDFVYKENGTVVDTEKGTYETGEFTITFKEDGTYKSSGEESYSSTWKLVENTKLILDGDEATITKWDANNLNLSISSTYTEDGVKYEETGVIEMVR